MFMQISAKFPFKIDIAFVSGTGLDSSRVEERISSLTGLFHIHLILISNKEEQMDG